MFRISSRILLAGLGSALALAGLFVAVPAHAAVGLAELPGLQGDGPVTVYYPSSAAEQPVRRGRFELSLAVQGPVQRGNGRLIVISHGTSGAPWVHADLARAMVEAGYVVAMPEHRADNYKDPSEPGPESWKRRPAEVSRAIDAVAADARFAPLLALDKVGMYGYSAGGHTALSLAGGRWSPELFRKHCEAHLAEDFPACVGIAFRLDGGLMDGMKKSMAMGAINRRFADPTWFTHDEPRIRVIVAGAPGAMDFEAASLASPRVPLGLITLGQDKWLTPRFHSAVVLAACTGCERIADLPDAGHGALMSPQPPLEQLPPILADLLRDPPGFDRGVLPEVDRKSIAFLSKYLLP